MSISTASTSQSANITAQPLIPTESSHSAAARAKKTGRPNKWTASRQRKLARLYLFSKLPREDITLALKEKEDHWLPGEVSTTKIVNALLNKEPRWLRPKDRADMDKRITGLSECKTQRKLRRNQEESVLHSPLWRSELEFDCNFLDPTVRADRLSEIDERSMSTYLSTSSLKRRLSQYSTLYIKAIARLMQAHSISDSSTACTLSINTDEEGSTLDGRTMCPSPSTEISARFRISSLILPSAFLVLDRYVRRQGLCIPGFKAHDSKTCWCLEELNIDSQIWVCQTGLVNQQVADPPESLVNLNLEFRDAFGNTVLHMLAARGANIMVIIDALEQGVNGNARNLAGQNFLHVLRRHFLCKLAEDQHELMVFLQKINSFGINFLDCDIYGRSFFHLLSHWEGSREQISYAVMRYLNSQFMPLRDAFGWVPTKLNHRRFAGGAARSHIGQNPVGREIYEEKSSPILTASWAIYEDRGSVPTNMPLVDLLLSKDEAFTFKHARLLETAAIAIDVPSIQDSEGRNGLQCLAEASLTLNIDNEKVPSGISNKRKRDKPDPDSSRRLMLRYELVQKMIQLGVDINNYDERGNTVLIAFVTHLQDGEDDRTLAKILEYLISNGANLHWRNRQGEAPLHIAVRLGHKVATKVLLENGANVHARTPEGKGVLALGEMHYIRAGEDPPLYASIMACMAICIQYGAVAAPTLVQEWTMKD